MKIKYSKWPGIMIWLVGSPKSIISAHPVVNEALPRSHTGVQFVSEATGLLGCRALKGHQLPTWVIECNGLCHGQLLSHWPQDVDLVITGRVCTWHLEADRSWLLGAALCTGLYSLDADVYSHPCCETQKCIQTLPSVPRGCVGTTVPPQWSHWVWKQQCGPAYPHLSFKPSQPPEDLLLLRTCSSSTWGPEPPNSTPSCHSSAKKKIGSWSPISSPGYTWDLLLIPS